MVHNRVWSVAAVFGIVLTGAVLASCGSGSAGHSTGLSGSSTSASATTVPPVTTSPTTAAGGSNGAGPVLIVRTSDGTVGYDGREPSTIGFSKDSSNIVTHLVWSSWGPTTAVGHGTLGINNCKPNCATGKVTQIPATVQLRLVVNGHFTAMTEKSGSSNFTYSYPSNWAASAS